CELLRRLVQKHLWMGAQLIIACRGNERFPGPELGILQRLGPGLESVREYCAVPEGTPSYFPLYPALPRWAKLFLPSSTPFRAKAARTGDPGCGACFLRNSFHRAYLKRVLTQALKRGNYHGIGLFSFSWIKKGFGPIEASFSDRYCARSVLSSPNHEHSFASTEGLRSCG